MKFLKSSYWEFYGDLKIMKQEILSRLKLLDDPEEGEVSDILKEERPLAKGGSIQSW